ILGNAGSGKSTLARRLGERLGLPVIHTDAIFWEPGWVEPENDAFRARLSAALAGDAWVSDGNYAGRTFDLRLPRADLVIWLDTPRGLCLWRVIARSVRGGRRPDMAEGCEEKMIDAKYFEFLRFAWDYDRKSRPRIEAARAAMAPETPVMHLSGKRAIETFLAGAG
ncbi:MAG: hypothetical protein ACREEB_13670, partial [Caulobacteraceae bacterium]